MGFCGEFKVWTFYNSVHRTSLLAETAVDAPARRYVRREQEPAVGEALPMTLHNAAREIEQQSAAGMHAKYSLGHVNVVSAPRELEKVSFNLQRGGCSSSASTVIPGRPPAAVLALFGLNCDGQSRANRFTELAGDAALLPSGVASQCMLSSKAWAYGTFLKWVVELQQQPGSEREKRQQAGPCW